MPKFSQASQEAQYPGCPGSALRSPLSWTYLKLLTWVATRSNAGTPQLAPVGVEEQWVYSQLKCLLTLSLKLSPDTAWRKPVSAVCVCGVYDLLPPVSPTAHGHGVGTEKADLAVSLCQLSPYHSKHQCFNILSVSRCIFSHLLSYHSY